MASSILIVSANFAPCGQIGARRAEKIAAHLAGSGWEVTVLTLKPEYVPPIDPQRMPPAGVEVIQTAAFLPRMLLRRRVQRATGRGSATSTSIDHPTWPGSRLRARMGRAGRRLLGLVEYLDEFSGWSPYALSAVRGRRFDVVLGTLPPYTAAWIALKIARRTEARLVLDYRDPWHDLLSRLQPPSLSPAGLRKHQRAEDICLDSASLVLGVSPTICNWLRQHTETPVELLPQGFEASSDAATSTAATPSTVVYSGTLAYGRTLRSIFEALSLLPDTPASQQLQLVYCGPHSAQARAEAKAAGVESRFRDHGQVSLAASTKLLRAAGAGLVIISKGYEYAYPGKLFDIMGTRTPIVLLGPPDSDAAQLVSRYDLGWCHTSADIPGLAASLRETQQNRRLNPDRMQDLTVSTLMSRLDGLLRDLLDD